MKLNKLSFFVLISLLVISCSGGGGGGSGTSTPAVTLTSIAVTPANTGMLPGTTKQFTATGTYSDNTTQNITSSVTWSSSNETVATIGTSSGLATAAAAGTTTITALSGNINGSTQLTVQNDNNDNVLKVTVNGSLCSSSNNSSYPNKPCVSVTVCSPGTSTCQTIDDILLDTGASGLRIFSSVLTIPLTQVSSGSGSLANCEQFADGSAEWGPVQMADIILGNEPAVKIPIQIIDSTFGSVPSSCGTPDSSPSVVGFNGILGIGLFAQDCGLGCTPSQDPRGTNGMYYSCIGSLCTGTAVSLGNQVQNPVSHLPADNNGIIVQLPLVPSGGAASVDGNLILGIGTRSNNIPSGVTMYPANSSYGEFITIFNEITYSHSFIDSGSNGLFFNASSLSALTTCGAWYCPFSIQSLSATTKGYAGTPSSDVSFYIGNASNLFRSSNNVFIELGGQNNTHFDWGLPFFLGRSVYVGIENKTSSLGTGPYWAY